MEILTITAGVLAANILTVSLAWGMWRAFKITDDRTLDRYTFLALALPILVFVAGFLVAKEKFNEAPAQWVVQEVQPEAAKAAE